MNRTPTFVFTLALSGLGCAIASGCSPQGARSDFEGAVVPNGSDAAVPPDAGEPPAFSEGGGGGKCPSSPGNFDIPNNGCDDDGDGTIDNAAGCDTGLPLTGDAAAFAKALGVCSVASGPSDVRWGVISATYTQGFNKTAAPADEQHGLLGKFGDVLKPREGSMLGVLSTGWAREFNKADGLSTFKGGQKMTGLGAVPPGFPKPANGCGTRTDVHDVISVELTIKVPNNALGVAFDFDFHSGEWPEFVCTNYNDGFIAFLSSSAFNGGKPDNISFDALNNPVSVNNGFFDHCTPGAQTGCKGGYLYGGGTLATAACAAGESDLAGTGFEAKGVYCDGRTSTGGGSTGWLTSQAPVAAGEVITLAFTIWDTGDFNFDSSVLLDHLTWLPAATDTKTERPK